MEEIYQVIAKLVDGKCKTLNFTSPSISIISIKSRIHELTSIPIREQLLLSNGKQLEDNKNLEVISSSDGHHRFFPTVHLLLRLRGGKGGFGSLLRGAATKAGQKKTNNFDACRDINGRRVRHVNAEKKMEEWMAEEKERQLEKMAEDYIKKRVKMAKKNGGVGDGGAEKYVEKYRKDSAKCTEDVDKSVRESLGAVFKSKRKVATGEVNGSQAKKLKIWVRNESDSDDMDEDDSDDIDEDDSDDKMGEEKEKSVVTNKDNHSDSNKGAGGSLGSITGGKLDGESSVGCSSESSLEEEESVLDGRLGSFGVSSGGSLNGEGDNSSEPVVGIHEESIVQNKDLNVTVVSGNEAEQAEMEKSNKSEFGNVEEIVCEVPGISIVREAGASDVEAIKISDFKPVVDEETVAAKGNGPDLEKPVNFEDFNSAAEMEVLGMERLKSELQERGLKCGGTLQERAARLFLLKTTPLERLQKKLLARK